MKIALKASLAALGCCLLAVACGGGGGSAGTATAGNGGGAGGLTMEDACEQLATAGCDGMERCDDSDLIGDYGGDKTLCVSRNKTACVASLGLTGSVVTAAAVASCAQARTGITCVGYYDAPPTECDFRGAKENDAACALGMECKSGVCLSIGDSGCGVCTDQPGLDEGCDFASGCGRLVCTLDNQCAKYGLLGAGCDDSTAPCNPTYECDEDLKQCTEVVMDKGGDCSLDDCSDANGLDCSTTTMTCEPYPTTAAGEDCGFVCGSSYCAGETTCTAWAADGADCSTTLCQPPATCAAGKCTLAPPTCQ
jgi:hypothetical protein